MGMGWWEQVGINLAGTRGATEVAAEKYGEKSGGWDVK